MRVKNKLSNSGFFHFIKQLIPTQSTGDRAEAEHEKNKTAVENRLRWEDDGGRIIEADQPTTLVTESHTIQPQNVVEGA